MRPNERYNLHKRWTTHQVRVTVLIFALLVFVVAAFLTTETSERLIGIQLNGIPSRADFFPQ